MEEGVLLLDLIKLLIIEIKFLEFVMFFGLGSESTDIVLEVGSCFSSFNSGFNFCQNSFYTDNGVGIFIFY